MMQVGCSENLKILAYPNTYVEEVDLGLMPRKFFFLEPNGRPQKSVGLYDPMCVISTSFFPFHSSMESPSANLRVSQLVGDTAQN